MFPCLYSQFCHIPYQLIIQITLFCQSGTSVSHRLWSSRYKLVSFFLRIITDRFTKITHTQPIIVFILLRMLSISCESLLILWRASEGELCSPSTSIWWISPRTRTNRARTWWEFSAKQKHWRCYVEWEMVDERIHWCGIKEAGEVTILG